MDDSSKQLPSFGNGGQRNQPSRPFFFVQPPSQPYFLYQHLQLNNPYAQYGLPGGFNVGRPCMPPYSYVPYPGFVLPHAPIYPMDYRRVFEPRFHSPAWGEMPRPQPQAQPPRRRETACSEAQTDPSDAITKLIECLDKIRVSELQGGDRELDSGVASHSFSMSPPGEQKKREEQDHSTPLEGRGCCLESPTVTFGESSVAVDDSESSQAALDTQSSQACWSGGLEEELPIDSSSVHEDCEHKHPAAEERFFSLEREQVTDIQSNISVTDSSVPRCDLEKPTQPPPTSSSPPESKEAKSSEVVSDSEHPADELGCQILKLPFDCVLAPGAAAGAADGHVLSPAAPYYYNYLSMQATHERMSVLSPSLDELSSRDEMFSTDLEDVDLFPKHVYAGRRLAEVMGGSPHRNEVWLPDMKRYMCACCGKSLNKGSSRSKTSKIYWDEGGDSEEEEEEEGKFGRSCEQPVRVVVRKHISPRKSYILPARHAPKSWYKRGQYREAPEPAEQDQEGEDGKQQQQQQQQQEAAKAEEEQDDSKLQCRTCQDRPCRDAGTTVDQWAEEVIPRRRHAAPPQRQDMDAVTATLQHSYSVGQHGPTKALGAKQSHGSPPEPGRPAEQQQHHKPFFYVQSSQPCFPMQPLQWPLPYNPYYNYPGLGFGLPVMPHYQMNPYMEPPGFIVPHTQLHLMDYRRMLSPQYYQNMAFHARRFRCQQASAFRETTTSEVQTEPLQAVQRTLAESAASSRPGSSGGQPRSSERGDCPAALQYSPSLSSPGTPSKSSLVIQTEETEGCSTPPRLPLVHEKTKTWSQTSPPQDKMPPAEQSKSAVQVCPDILLVGTPNSGSEEWQTSAAENLEAEETPGSPDDQSVTPSFHLPFEPKYLDELRKMESIVWSARETSVSSVEPLVQNTSTNATNESMGGLEESLRAEPERPPMDSFGNETVPEADLCFVMEDLASEDSQKSEMADKAEKALFSTLLLESSPLQARKVPPRREMDPSDHQDTSFESLPAYLPSSSWLSDFENIYYSSKMLPASRKPSRPLGGRGVNTNGRRRKPDLEFKEPPKQRFKLQEKVDRRSLSDHECCLSRKFNEDLFNPHDVTKAERLCSRCLSKRRICSSSSPAWDGLRGLKRKAAPFQQWNDVLLPTCDACTSHAKIRLRKASDPDLHVPRRGPDMEGESDGNSSCPAGMKWRSADAPRKLAGIKRPLASKQNVCTAVHPKLRDRCVCTELHPQLAAWERPHHRNHGNNIPETDENCFVPGTLQAKLGGGDQPCRGHGWQAERSWRDAMPNMDHHRPQHSNKHKVSQPQGNRTKDTRC